ncbi:hypothetical protein [Pseudomonas simiae]|jgi:hypothetical protein|uniref:Uncharacterized protein n=1 Tax=Pseudomonas simiae TaxID=321846 RepID=A0A1N7U4N3_9PSED|nr:hypothetical protein [Pseudomonas simiae]AIB37887.1 hypothetical protein PS417_20355 [Pseudomonas simiae]
MINHLSKQPLFALDSDSLVRDFPFEVIQAQGIDWSVTIDAFLADAARAGRRYAALVYGDRSGVNQDGMTIATPPLEYVEARSGFKLMRSVSGKDYYVITSELSM